MDTDQIKQINSLRFGWHEQLLRDPEVRKHPIALVLAGHIMHRFDPQRGYAELSFKAVANALGLHKKSVIRARDFLLLRGWIQQMERVPSESGVELPSRYSLAGGPDDLLLDQHAIRSIEAVRDEALPLFSLPSDRAEKEVSSMSPLPPVTTVTPSR